MTKPVRIPEFWRRIAGVHVQEDGNVGAVWLALDPNSDVVWVYDAAIFRSQVMAQIAEGMSGRGGWIPVAWHKSGEDFVSELLDRGVNVLPDPVKDSPPAMEESVRRILGRLESSRFRVPPYVGSWLDEHRRYVRVEEKLPKDRDSFPLMMATQYAVSMINWAIAQRPPKSRKPNHPKVAIV